MILTNFYYLYSMKRHSKSLLPFAVAAAVVLAHNHVSGLALPSDEDKATTLYLQTLLSQVGVLLDDHLIFVDDDMVSLKDSGLLPEVK